MKSFRVASTAPIVVALLVLGLAQHAMASSGPRWSEQQLTDFSAAIVAGRVSAIATAADGSGGIYTYVSIDVSEVLKGAVPDGRLVLKQAGGILGEIGLDVPGQASFTIGEEVLVFAEVRPRDATLYTSALWQGKWAIEIDAATGARVAVQRAILARARIALDKCDLRAPFAGIVSELFVEIGEWALPGKLGVRLLDPERYYVRAELDEVDIGAVGEGLPARVTLDPWRDRRLSGRVTRVAPVVSEKEEQNRTLEVEVEFTGGAEGLDLKPGTSSDVSVLLSAPDGPMGRAEPGGVAATRNSVGVCVWNDATE